MPQNITPIFLPSRAPELNPVENIWQYLCQNWLSNRVFDDYDAIIDMLSAIGDLFPSGANYDKPDYWAGLRPMTPEGTPVFGRGGYYSNMTFNVGHGHMGWTMSAGSARITADIVKRATPEFSPEGMLVKARRPLTFAHPEWPIKPVLLRDDGAVTLFGVQARRGYALSFRRFVARRPSIRP